MKKRILTILLVLVLLVGSLPAGAISGDYDRNARECAVLLYNYGLLDGTGTLADGTIDFSLERPMTRGEAITMVVRLTGGKEDALSGGYSHPFTDVDSWGDPYVGYAYAMGISNGVSATSFGFKNYISQREYLTLMLRGMGYDWVDWRDPYTTAAQADLLEGRDYDRVDTFLRKDMALLSYGLLNTMVVGADTTLYGVLEEKGVLIYRELPTPNPTPTPTVTPTPTPTPTVTPTPTPTPTPDPTPTPAFTPGPVYNNVSNTATITSTSELMNAFLKMMDARLPQVIFQVPRGQEEFCFDLLGEQLQEGRFTDVKTMNGSWSVNGGQLTLKITYDDSVRVMAYMEGKLDTLSSQDMALYQKAVEVHDSLTDATMSEYERVKAFHDYLCDTVTYVDQGDVSHTAYGALVNGKAVCQGYAQAMDLLCYLSGIECRYVSGEGTNSQGETGPHGWVKVKVDGVWYNADPTWADQVTYISYKYFLVSDDHFYGHSWVAYPHLPASTTDYPDGL